MEEVLLDADLEGIDALVEASDRCGDGSVVMEVFAEMVIGEAMLPVVVEVL